MNIVFLEGDYCEDKINYVYRHTVSDWKRNNVDVIWINNYVTHFRKKLSSMDIIYIVKQKNILLTIKIMKKALISWLGGEYNVSKGN